MTSTAPPRLDANRAHEVLRRLELTVKHRLDGLLQGDYRGLTPGHGSELGETREYQHGDDVRRIDWNVTARQQVPHIRETIADRELETWLLVDLSPSLDFGTAACTKRDLALAAAAAVGFLTARGGNRIGSVLMQPGKIGGLPARSGRNHLLAVLHRLATAPKVDGGGTTVLTDGLDHLGSVARRRGLAVVISDFLASDEWADALRRLTVRHEVLAIEIVDPRELELPAVGVLAVVDPETGERREVQTSNTRLRQRYADAAIAQRATIAQAIRGAGSDHLVLRTDGDWVGDLVRFVVLRRQRTSSLPRPQR